MKNLLRLAASTAVFWIPVIVFSYLASEIIEIKPPAVDIAILSWIHAHGSHLQDTIFLTASTIGNAIIITPLVLLMGAGLWFIKRKKDALALGAIFFGAAAANFVLKLLFQRDRPSLSPVLLHETSYSFPSGHAMASSALAFGLIAISWRTKWRWPVTLLSIAFMLAVGYSRLYVGVHYPTDVVAGWCASLAWIFIVIWAIDHTVWRINIKRAYPWLRRP